MIEISHLQKSFGEVKAVQDLSFSVKAGSLFAFLGVNGAGKSTTINIMCGQLSKDGGSVVIDGADLDKDSNHIKGILGVVFQNSVLDSALSVRDNLRSRAALYHITGEAFEKRLQELAKLLHISDTQMGYITNAQPGHGLLRMGGALVPFANTIPHDSIIYKLMSTTPGEK